MIKIKPRLAGGVMVGIAIGLAIGVGTYTFVYARGAKGQVALRGGTQSTTEGSGK